MTEPISAEAHDLAACFVGTSPPLCLIHACDSALLYLSCLLREEKPNNKEIRNRLEELYKAAETIELALGSSEIQAALDQHTGAETAEVGPGVGERLKQARDAAAWLRRFTGRAAFGVTIEKGVGRPRLAGRALEDRENAAALVISFWRELRDDRLKPSAGAVHKACEIAFASASPQSHRLRLGGQNDLRNWGKIIKRTQLWLNRVAAPGELACNEWQQIAAAMISDGRRLHPKCAS